MTAAAWYIIASKNIWARWFNLLHWPYTLWHLSYVVIGAGLANQLDWALLGWTVLAFFLGMGIAAHCFDLLKGDPLRLGIKAGQLRFVGLAALAGAMALGIWQIWAGQVPPQLGLAVPTGAALAYGYGQEWRGFHGDWQFAAWWAVFPFLVGYLAQGLDFSFELLPMGSSLFLTALVQRILSTRVRFLRRQVGKATVTLETWHEGQQEELRTFGTVTPDLLELSDWLAGAGITHVAMESTGVYWKPVFNLLESEFSIILVNAKHIKHVPGRKTDVKDAQWIAQLLQHGLLKASFIPPAPQRALRDLVRYRTKLIQERSQETNRVQKVLEDANLKLASVVSDIMGVSAQEMLACLIAGHDEPHQLAQLARGRMRSKIDELERALTGHMADFHRLLLKMHLHHIDTLNDMIERLSDEIDHYIEPFNQADEIERLDEIPGVGPQVAQSLVAELGIDMSRFPTAGHAVSWAGLAPGRNESAGRNRSSKTVKGNRHLKSILVQAAHTVARSKDNYLGAQFRRLAARRGKKRAAVAVARSVLVIAYHMLHDGTRYVDLGVNYFDKLDQANVERRLINRLSKLGYKVNLESVAS